MQKLKIFLKYDEKGESIVDMFLLTEAQIEKIAQDIDKQFKIGSSIQKALLHAIKTYKDAELLMALSLIFNVCFVDYHIQREMNLAFSLASCGARMPAKMQ